MLLLLRSGGLGWRSSACTVVDPCSVAIYLRSVRLVVGNCDEFVACAIKLCCINYISGALVIQGFLCAQDTGGYSCVDSGEASSNSVTTRFYSWYVDSCGNQVPKPASKFYICVGLLQCKLCLFRRVKEIKSEGFLPLWDIFLLRIRASCCSEGWNVTRHSMSSMWECRSFVCQLLWHYKSCLKCSYTSLWCLWIEIGKWFLEVLFAGFLPISRVVCKYWDRAGNGLQWPNQHLWSLTTMHQHARPHLVLRTI